MNVIKRILAPTPRFFKQVRNAGLLLSALSGVVLTSPLALPATLLSIAGYLALAGGVMGAVSQLAVTEESQKDEVSTSLSINDTTTVKATDTLPRLRWMRAPEDKDKKYVFRHKVIPRSESLTAQLQ